MGALCPRVGALERAEQLVLEAIGGIDRELFVGLAEAGERERDLIGRDREIVEDLLPGFAGRERDSARLPMLALRASSRRTRLSRPICKACPLRVPRIVDLTQPLGPETVLWPGSVPIELETVATIDSVGHYAQALSSPEHAGTHLDAPAHFVAGGRTADSIPVEELVVPCAVLDVRERAAADPDYVLEAAALEELEHRDGRIEPGSAALLSTGWDAYVGDRQQYLGGESAGRLHFPGFGASAARALVERGVAGIGIDTVSVDRGSDIEFPVHNITLPAGAWHLEGLVGLGALPARGATLVVGALPIRGGSGAPARVVAIVP